MDRRAAIATISCGVVLIPGCVNSLGENGTWNPAVAGGDVELEPGEDTVVQIEADDIRAMQILPEGNTAYESIDNGGEVTIQPLRTIDPQPDRYIDVEPQIYGWNSTESVKLQLSIEATNDATSDEYPYSVTVFEGEGDTSEGGKSEEFGFGIRVSE